ncbi:unnamed protein product [Ranitomeya imitator]|uniref:GIY-YIG domain-containing protein n=1 Tax=Ranitomeya imitator TaxID=111125 RepID=A0ABN9LLM5_9NEOB|nr:unnamed protein product [Ranitomeya imitator]
MFESDQEHAQKDSGSVESQSPGSTVQENLLLFDRPDFSENGNTKYVTQLTCARKDVGSLPEPTSNGGTQHMQYYLSICFAGSSGTQRVYLRAVSSEGNQGKHWVTKRGPALSYPMFTLVTGIIGRWRASRADCMNRFQEVIERELKQLKIRDTASNTTNNLTKKQRNIIKEIQDMKDITIKMSDKGGVVVIMDSSQYRNGILDLLSDDTTYRKLKSDPTFIYKTKMDNVIQDGLSLGVISSKQAEFLKIGFELVISCTIHCNTSVRLVSPMPTLTVGAMTSPPGAHCQKMSGRSEHRWNKEEEGFGYGIECGAPYTNAYMAHFEDTLIYTCDLFRTYCVVWKRYIDDIFCVWKGDLTTLETFFLFLKSSWPGLDFTMTHHHHEISFLDTLVMTDIYGNLSTDLYSKPTDLNSLLDYDSFHPRRMINSIPKSQIHRVHKIVSDPSLKAQRTTEMQSKFQNRGYPPQVLNLTQNTRRRENPMGPRIPFVHQYHPAAYRIHRSIHQHWHILKTAYPTIEKFKNPFLPCFRRARNIRDTLVRADIGPSRSPSSQRFLCNPKKGTFPCLNCNQCSNVLKGDTIYHPYTRKMYNINNSFTCNSNFVVYLIKCPCGLLYVGETTQAIKDRISKHKSTIRCKNLLLPIPDHFSSKGHSVSQLRFQVIEQVTPPRRGGDRISILKRREAFWIHELNTLSPKGLNRDYDLQSFM